MTNHEEKLPQKKSRWGLGIGLLYGGFVVFIVSVVIFATFQDFSLVEDNYYQHSLAFQDKINSQKNAQNLKVKPVCQIDKESNQIVLTFPPDLLTPDFAGTILFFRASDSKVDRLVNLTLKDDGTMTLPLDGFISGNWKIKLQWRSLETDYFIEQLLTI